ncbi:MAG: alpha/beta hydrolase [Solirubrobacterales bacterium]
MEIEIKGRLLHLEVAGPEEAPPVLFLHGLSASGETFAWLPDEVTARRRVLRMDLRGHGRSDPAPGAYTVADYGGDVVGVLREAVGRPAVLVGHSLGACVAWWVAQQHPELVRAALLEDPPLYLGEAAEHAANPHLPLFAEIRDAARAWQAEAADPVEIARQIAAEPAVRAGIPAGSGPATVGEVLTPDAPLAIADGMLAMDPEVMSAAAERLTLGDLDTTAPVAVPVLLLAAGVAPAFRAEHAARLARTHPAVEVRRIEGAGHEIHDEAGHRETYLAILAEFLGRHAG